MSRLPGIYIVTIFWNFFSSILASKMLLSNLITTDYITISEILVFFFFSVPCSMWILVPGPGIEPQATAVKAQSCNHWSARELPRDLFSLLLWSPNFPVTVFIPLLLYNTVHFLVKLYIYKNFFSYLYFDISVWWSFLINFGVVLQRSALAL